MPNEPWAVASMVLASVIAAVATFLLKRGAAETRLSLHQFHISLQVIGAAFLYLLSSVFSLLALLGAQLSVLVPVTALEYVWVLLLAKGFLRERIGAPKVLGVACIMLGVILVGLGS